MLQQQRVDRVLLQNVRPGQGSCNIWAGPILEAGLLQRGHLSHRPSSVQRQFSSGFVLAACSMCVCPPLFQDQTRVLFDNSLALAQSLSRFHSLSFCNTCVFNDDDDESLKLSEIFWCKIATSSLRDSRGLEALKCLWWFCSRFFPGSSFIFLFLFGPTARARMFLICSRSFSLSRPPTAAGSPAPPPPQSQESKVEKRILVATTLNFSSREKPVRVLSCHGCRRPRFCCVVKVLPRGLHVPDPDCVFYSHTRTGTLTLTRAAHTNERNGKRKILFSAY